MSSLYSKESAEQCCGSVAFWYGSGSADQYLRLSDPDPAIFVSDLQGGNQKLLVFFYFFNKFFS
jgi:hypothetical protein